LVNLFELDNLKFGMPNKKSLASF